MVICKAEFHGRIRSPYIAGKVFLFPEDGVIRLKLSFELGDEAVESGLVWS